MHPAIEETGVRVEPDDFLFIHINHWAPIASPDSIPISESYLLAYLVQHGFTGSMLGDFRDRMLQPGTLARALTTRHPRILGFSVYQENVERVRLWARYAKKLHPELRVLLGGPQVTFMPGEALLQMPEVDFLCRGEGEVVTLGLARALAAGEDPAGVPGIALRSGDRIIETGPAAGAENLDTYPSPYLMDLVDLEEKQRIILLTSRGCAFPCLFCYTPQATGRKVRFHSIDRVIAEMQSLKAQGVSDFWFADPNFAHSVKRLRTLLDRIITDVGDVTFWCQMRSDRVTRDLLDHLHRAGAHAVAYGLESADPKILDRIDKRLDPEHLKQVISWTQDFGMEVELFTMFGLPGEEWDQAMKTLDLLNAHGVPIEGNSVSQQLHLFFGAKMAEDPEAYGIRPLPWTRPAYLSVCRDYETDNMTAAEIEQVSLVWRVNRSDFVEDVRHGRHLFDRSGFLTRHKKALAKRPEPRCLQARIYLQLEEYEAAWACLDSLLHDFPEDPQVQKLTSGPFITFKNCRGQSEAGFKVIYDCQGFIDGEQVPATVARFQTAVLGNGQLLPDFEQGLTGVRPGHWKELEVTFPTDYGHKALAGRTAYFQAVAHQVFTPVIINDLASLRNARQPRYRLADLTGLRKHNINLYYMVLRDTSLHALTQDMTEYFLLMEFYLKLGFSAEAESLARSLKQEPAFLLTSARLFRNNGLSRTALNLLVPVAGADEAVELLRAQSLFDCGEYSKAERIASGLNHVNKIELRDLQVKLSARLRDPIETYLERFEGLLEARTSTLLADEWASRSYPASSVSTG